MFARRHARADSALHDRRLCVVHAVAGRHGRALAEASRSRWQTSAAISGTGAIVTGIVLLVVAVTKAHEGAWIIMLLIPIQVVLFRITRAHYNAVAAQLTLTDFQPEVRHQNRVIVPISGVQRAVVGALDYARTLSSDVRAVYIDVDPASTAQIRTDWDKWGRGVQLVVLASPFRSLMEPLLEYIEQLERGTSGRLRDGRAARIRAGALVAPPLSQSARAAHQGRAAVQAEHDRHERAFSPGAVTHGHSHSRVHHHHQNCGHRRHDRQRGRTLEFHAVAALAG